MAVRPDRPPRPATAQGRVRDVDDAIADKLHGKKKSLHQVEKAEVRQEHQDKPTARKPGHAVDRPGEQDEEQVADSDQEARNQVGQSADAGIKRAARKKKPAKAKKPRDKKQKDGSGQQGGQDGEPQQESLSLSQLASDRRVNLARERGFQQTPGIGEVVLGKQGGVSGESFAELLPSARKRTVDLEEPELRPPPFLSAFEAMKDIYLRVKGRASPRTKELLEGPDLEDLVKMTSELCEDEELRRNPEARVQGKIWVKLRDDPGPLLLGLNDDRLTEPWRLFLDGWDIWVPENKSEFDEDDEAGVELFWEGEGEDESGDEIEILQVLRFRGDQVMFSTTFGELSDEVTFDGTTFYRLRTRP